MPSNSGSGNRGGGFMSRLGQGIRTQIRNSPAGHLAHGEFGQAFQSIPAVRLARALAGGVRNVAGAFNGPGRPSAPGAYGPQRGGYAGAPGQGPTPDAQFGADAATDWSQYVQPDPNMGPPQYSAPTADPSVSQYGPNSSRTMGTGAFSSGYGATGANVMGMMGAGGLLRQSGDSGLGRQRPQQN